MLNIYSHCQLFLYNILLSHYLEQISYWNGQHGTQTQGCEMHTDPDSPEHGGSQKQKGASKNRLRAGVKVTRPRAEF